MIFFWNIRMLKAITAYCPKQNTLFQQTFFQSELVLLPCGRTAFRISHFSCLIAFRPTYTPITMLLEHLSSRGRILDKPSTSQSNTSFFPFPPPLTLDSFFLLL